jgi:hypothetical protein
LGLFFVVLLLFYLQSHKIPWLIAAGIATGAAFLTKMEIAIACAGTGVFFLSWIALFPTSFGIRRSDAIRALAVYVVSAAILAGAGYGLLIQQAGWRHVWAGVTTYGQAAFLLKVYPPLGTAQSWGYIFSGLGILLLTSVALVGALTPTMIRKRVWSLIILILFCLALIVLPWILISRFAPGWLSYVTKSRLALVTEAIKVVNAPWTVILSVLIIGSGIRWFRAYRRGQILDQVEWFYAVLVVYSALVAARFYLNPIVDLLSYYVGTLAPVLIFSALVLVPRALERWGQIGLQRSWAQTVIVVLLVMYAIVGVVWNVKFFSLMDNKVVTPRGRVLMRGGRLELETLQYILSHTEQEDAIVVLDFAPGFYFLSGRRNPLWADCILPVDGPLPRAVDKIVGDLAMHQPRLIIIPEWMEQTRAFTPLRAPRSGSEQYEALEQVWQYVHDHYEIRHVTGENPWRYNIYVPLDTLP